VLPVGYPDRYLGLIAHLAASSEWTLAFTDGTETLFARKQSEGGEGLDLGAPATTDRIALGFAERFGAAPRLREAARLQLAALDVALQKYGEAMRVLAQSSAPEADALRARALLSSGDLAGARVLGERLLSRDARDVRSLNLMAMVSLRLGRSSDALDFLRRALSADPFDGEAESILSSLEDHAQR
jgi:tetratricopeptide (TPR) repeat protein